LISTRKRSPMACSSERSRRSGAVSRCLTDSIRRRASSEDGGGTPFLGFLGSPGLGLLLSIQDALNQRIQAGGGQNSYFAHDHLGKGLHTCYLGKDEFRTYDRGLDLSHQLCFDLSRIGHNLLVSGPADHAIIVRVLALQDQCSCAG